MNLLELAQNDPYFQKCCYLTDNYFAYYYDAKKDFKRNMKMTNFVPTYDKWCLECDKRYVKLRCSKCKSVYFCNEKCQKKAWDIHKKHCGRDLFSICCSCGSNIDQNTAIKCIGECPVKFCSEECKQKIIEPHLDIDCKNFQKQFR
jgi:hypothetical protein